MWQRQNLEVVSDSWWKPFSKGIKGARNAFTGTSEIVNYIYATYFSGVTWFADFFCVVPKELAKKTPKTNTKNKRNILILSPQKSTGNIQRVVQLKDFRSLVYLTDERENSSCCLWCLHQQLTRVGGVGGWREGGDLGVTLSDFNSEVRKAIFSDSLYFTPEWPNT